VEQGYVGVSLAWIVEAMWDNQNMKGQNKLGPSKNRWLKRSKTYLGIAEAMAEQWGNA